MLALQGNAHYLAGRNGQRSARAAVCVARADFLPCAGASGTLGSIGPGERRAQTMLVGDQPDYCSSRYSLGLQYDLSGAKLDPLALARAQERAIQECGIPVAQGLRRAQRVQEAAALQEDAEYNVRADALGLETEVSTALRDQEATRRTTILQGTVRTTAEEKSRFAKERCRFGAAGLVEAVDADRASVPGRAGIHRRGFQLSSLPRGTRVVGVGAITTGWSTFGQEVST